mmetsp:Transcript_1826/g.6512  ORF Transcript_1826/g.6512 Transcript_1826/m.6512 type:complete len:343 (+) Transcript_1826:465-1493(+)
MALAAGEPRRRILLVQLHCSAKVLHRSHEVSTHFLHPRLLIPQLRILAVGLERAFEVCVGSGEVLGAGGGREARLEDEELRQTPVVVLRRWLAHDLRLHFAREGEVCHRALEVLNGMRLRHEERLVHARPPVQEPGVDLEPDVAGRAVEYELLLGCKGDRLAEGLEDALCAPLGLEVALKHLRQAAPLHLPLLPSAAAVQEARGEGGIALARIEGVQEDVRVGHTQRASGGPGEEVVVAQPACLLQPAAGERLVEGPPLQLPPLQLESAHFLCVFLGGSHGCHRPLSQPEIVPTPPPCHRMTAARRCPPCHRTNSPPTLPLTQPLSQPHSRNPSHASTPPTY